MNLVRRKATRPQGLRHKRDTGDDLDTQEASTSVVTFEKKKQAGLKQATDRVRRRDIVDVDVDDEEEESLHEAKRTRVPSPQAQESVGDAPDIPSGTVADAEDEEGVYRGARNAKHQLSKSIFGPQTKARPANVQTITAMDYQMDICKDYKELGYCGFGDTCKFLHDRSDYLLGWQLDKQFADGQHRDVRLSNEKVDEEELPFACIICRKPFDDSVVETLCHHYFHSKCALKRFQKTSKCFVCGRSTQGVFNKAKRFSEKLRRRDEALKRKEAEEAKGSGGLDGIEGVDSFVVSKVERVPEEDQEDLGSDDEGEEDASFLPGEQPRTVVKTVE